jgi:hypothetical protein
MKSLLLLGIAQLIGLNTIIFRFHRISLKGYSGRGQFLLITQLRPHSLAAVHLFFTN